jgi:cell division protein FtsW (lipid II flippase)
MSEVGTYTSSYSQQAVPLGLGEHGRIYDYDLKLVACAAALLGIGLVMVASSSVSVADHRFEDPLHYFWRQSAAAVMGIIASCWPWCWCPVWARRSMAPSVGSNWGRSPYKRLSPPNCA